MCQGFFFIRDFPLQWIYLYTGFFFIKDFILPCIIVWGAPLLCEKARPDGVPQKGSAGMIITDIVDDNVQDYVRDFCVYVRRFCLELAQPI